MAGDEGLQHRASLGGPPAASALRREEPRLQPLPCAPPLAPAHRPARTACPARGRHRRGWRQRWGSPPCGSRSAWPSARPSQSHPGPGLRWCQQGAKRERNQALLAGHKWTGKSLSAKPSGKYFELCSVSLPPTVPTIPFHPVNHTLFPKTLTAWLPEGLLSTSYTRDVPPYCLLSLHSARHTHLSLLPPFPAFHPQHFSNSLALMSIFLMTLSICFILPDNLTALARSEQDGYPSSFFFHSWLQGITLEGHSLPSGSLSQILAGMTNHDMQAPPLSSTFPPAGGLYSSSFFFLPIRTVRGRPGGPPFQNLSPLLCFEHLLLIRRGTFSSRCYTGLVFPHTVMFFLTEMSLSLPF